LRSRAGASLVEAGPTFGELIRYLALGWSKRTLAPVRAIPGGVELEVAHAYL